jgi:hypothetical protein
MQAQATQWASRRMGIVEDGPELADFAQAAHLLSRATFGARQSELDHARSIGLDAWLEEQLAPETLDDSALEALIAQNLTTVAMTSGQILQRASSTGMANIAVDELRGATLLRQIYSRRQLFEVMAEFWTNHFAMFHVDGALRYLKTADDREVVRRHALGKFRDLLHGSAKSPAMLYSLDNYVNTKAGPNENYARELMELHTLGVGGGYTETDVKEVARAFTGWSISAFGGTDVTFVFLPNNHDDGAKTVLGTQIAAGQGVRDGEQVLDVLLAHPSTAKFIATKLVRRFVSDAPPATLVTAVAAKFTETGGDIKAMLRVIFKSPEFAASAEQKIKRPAEFVISTVRVLEAVVPGAAIRPLAIELNTLGQLPYMWPAPNGYPDVGAYWSSSANLLERFNFGFSVVEGKAGGGLTVNVDALLDGAASPIDIVDRLAGRVLRRALAPEDRAAFIVFVAQNEPPNRPLPDSLRLARATELLGTMLGSHYFQYR